MAILLNGLEIIDEDTLHQFTPWVGDNNQVGYRVMKPSGEIIYLYMNASNGGGGDPDHKANVFVYMGQHGDPAMDEPLHHYNIDE